MASGCGVSDERFDSLRPAFEERCVEAFERGCPASLAEHVAPGIAELLAQLESRASARLSLLTGNLEPIARLKLERAGIGRFFAAGQGAFGSDAERRELLGPIARARAGTPAEPIPARQLS